MKFHHTFLKFSWVLWFFLILGCEGEKAQMPLPAAPSGLTAAAISTTQIDLAWQDHTDYEEVFRVERKTGGSSYALIVELPPDTTAYSNTDLTSDTAYSYRVYTHNRSGDSGYSNEVTARTLSNLPGVPVGLLTEAVPGGQVNLSWSAGSGSQDGFEIERKTGGSGAYSSLGTLGGTVYAYSDAGLSPGVDYYYRIRAYNAYGNSDYSNEAFARALEPASLIAAGGFHTCALFPGGKVECWGDNTYGQLGNGSTASASIPVAVPGLAGVTAVSCGDSHTCVLTGSGGVKCWGLNDDGQLGDGTRTSSTIPVDTAGLSSGITAVSAGMWHTCAVTSAGKAECWGFNDYGQLGDGTSGTSRSAPVEVAGMTSGVTGISAGAYHTCAVTSIGAVKCWGLNDEYGQLGTGTPYGPEYCTGDHFDCSTIPVNVNLDLNSDFTPAVEAAAGGFHSCSRNNLGELKCWGNNEDGELGDDSSSTANANPVYVSFFSSTDSASGAQKISAGTYHSCVLTAVGSLQCWGENDWGQLGNGTTVISRYPKEVAGLSAGVTGVSAGGGHTCALLQGGWARCWGKNDFGQLGDGSLERSDIPVKVIGAGP